MEKKISDEYKVSWKLELERTVSELKGMDSKQDVYLTLILVGGWWG